MIYDASSKKESLAAIFCTIFLTVFKGSSTQIALQTKAWITSPAPTSTGSHFFSGRRWTWLCQVDHCNELYIVMGPVDLTVSLQVQPCPNRCLLWHHQKQSQPKIFCCLLHLLPEMVTLICPMVGPALIRALILLQDFTFPSSDKNQLVYIIIPNRELYYILVLSINDILTDRIGERSEHKTEEWKLMENWIPPFANNVLTHRHS